MKHGPSVCLKIGECERIILSHSLNEIPPRRFLNVHMFVPLVWILGKNEKKIFGPKRRRGGGGGSTILLSYLLWFQRNNRPRLPNNLWLPQIAQILNNSHLSRLGSTQPHLVTPTLRLRLRQPLQALIPRHLRLHKHSMHATHDHLGRFRQREIHRLHLIGRHPTLHGPEASRQGCFPESNEDQSGEHVACSTEEAVDGRNVDFE